MAKECYIERNFKPASTKLIAVMEAIIREYQAQGYSLTVRQLYYQLVARDVIENTLRSYKNTASLINDGKMAGLLDWDAIVDRTREFMVRSHWTSGGQIIRATSEQYFEDMWTTQDFRVFAIVEKEALVGVLEDTCRRYDVPLLAARGYPSGTVLREFAQMHLLPTLRKGQGLRILHLGDHDPSGIDMTRDLTERMSLFTYGQCDYTEVHRIALTMDQVEEVNPPENPAKMTDSRFDDYAAKYGESSWELDALSPSYLNELLESKIQDGIDDDAWEERKTRIEFVKDQLAERADEQEAIEQEHDNG